VLRISPSLPCHAANHR
ncbi:cys/Met metabolism PLP-dependent enzyme family protein, partial [Vibrio parahaemolyticus V-223/04]